MEHRFGFSVALKNLRNSKKLTQEDFSQVSSRTYLSTLERGLKSPTLDKVADLASVMEIHPLTLLVDSYLYADPSLSLEKLFMIIASETTTRNSAAMHKSVKAYPCLRSNPWLSRGQWVGLADPFTVPHRSRRQGLRVLRMLAAVPSAIPDCCAAMCSAGLGQIRPRSEKDHVAFQCRFGKHTPRA